MKLQDRKCRPLGLLSAIVMLMNTGACFAAGNWELGDSWYNDTSSGCAASSCHSTINRSPGTSGTQGIPSSGASTIQGRIDANMGSPRTTRLKCNSVPVPADCASGIHDTVSNIAAYLAKGGNYPKASSLAAETTSAFGSLSIGRTKDLSFRLTNSGTATLTLGVDGVSVSDSFNFKVAPNPCPPILAGSSCLITVTFQPKSESTLAATLTVKHDDYRGISSIDMSGTGLAQFTVAPETLTFPEAATPPKEPKISITDNKGDRLRICRSSATTFSFPTDYSIDAPYGLGGDGCFTADTADTSITHRTIELLVRFNDGGNPLGLPRNGALTIQRVDAGGNSLGDPVRTVSLFGNPGAFATVDETSLFGKDGDPSVEVDNDNALERTVNLYSKGSVKLKFDSSTFKISGASAADYRVKATGCGALAELPASNGGTPPSCVLTVIFNPSDVGQRNAKLTIAVAGSPQSVVELIGEGSRGPRLVLSRNDVALTSGAEVKFGLQTIGGRYPSVGVKLANGGTPGTGSLEVELPALGSVVGFSHVAGAGCTSISASAPCTVDLHFDPSLPQGYESAFTIRTRASPAAPYDEFVLKLSGQGTAKAIPVLSWTDPAGTPIATLTFANTDAGSRNTSKVRLYNAGPGGTLLGFSNAVGLDGASYVIDATDCASGRILYANMSCEIGVTFAPGTAGLKAAELNLVNDGNGPGQLVLRGKGMAVSPGGQLSVVPLPAFELTIAGSRSLPSELTLSNSGNLALTVKAIGVEGPFVVESRSCPPVPFVLASGTGCTISTTFAPTAAGTSTGTLRISTDAASGPSEVSLSAEAREAPDLSSGGCTLSEGASALDPTLWTLLLLAIAALLYRHRSARAAWLRRRGRK